MKEKYGSDYEGVDGDDSDSDETEDEDGEELTPAVDAAILRTLSLIQKKDPAIYDSNQSVFEGTRLRLLDQPIILNHSYRGGETHSCFHSMGS